MPASARRSVYLIETYWLPRTPFCLSSSDAGLVYLLLAARDEREDLASNIALEGSNGVELGMSLGNTLRHIGLCLRIGSKANDSNDVQCAVSSSVAASAKPMPDGLSG